MEDNWRDFWMCEYVTGQQLAKLYETYMMTMMMIIINFTLEQSTKAQRGSKGVALLFL
jgi:hypothetical protein